MLLIREWAGRERKFRLSYGDVLALEDACGKLGIGAIYMRVTTVQFSAQQIYETIRLALIGGGMDALDAKQLLRTHFDERPYMENMALAADILIELMTGIEPSKGEASEADITAPQKFSEAVQICQVFHMSPQDLKAMDYADFVNMIRGYNAASGKQVEMISEAEFMDLRAKYEPSDG